MTVSPHRAAVADATSDHAAGPASGRRALGAAVTAATVPAVVLSTLALAEPAAAAATTALPSYTVPHVSGQSPAAMAAPTRLAPMRSVPARYTVKRGDSIWAIATRYGLNPTSLLALNRLTGASVIVPGQVLRLTGAVSAPARTVAPAARRSAPQPATVSTYAGGTYTVRSGDTLSAIAARHGVSLSAVLSANGLSMRSVIYPGQRLRLTGTAAAPRPVAPAPVAAAPAARPAGGGSYTIKAGDTLGAIAARHGVSLSALLSANRMSASAIIYPGHRLTIPGTGTGGATVRPAASTPAPSSNLVPSTFLHYTYPSAVVADANRNKAALLASRLPSPAQMQQIVASTARSMGVDPALAMAFAYQESGFSAAAVSPANAIGTMQVIPSSGQWASQLVGRQLNLLNPYDNATAGIAIIRSLVQTSRDLDHAIGGYYQGQGSVNAHGFFADTRAYVASVKAHMARFR